MIKLNKSTFCFYIIALLYVLFLPVNVSANKISQNVFMLKENSDISVTATWENDTPNIKLISPDGEVFNISDSDKVGDNRVDYEIFGASKGQWGVEYDMKDNSEINLQHRVIRVNENIEELSNETEDEVLTNKALGIGLTALGVISSFVIILGSVYLYNKSS